MINPRNQLTGSPGTTVALSVSAAAASVMLKGGMKYRVYASVACNLAVGKVATNTDMPMAANSPEIFVFTPLGADVLVSVIAGGSGTVYFTPLLDGVGTNQ